MTNWKTSLEDSVYAFGAAAREHQRAYRAAALTAEAMDLDRLKVHDGQAANAHPGFTGEAMPHLQAVASIGRRYLNLQHELQRDYELAARVYAWGAHWATRQVLTGQTPQRVVIEYGENGTPVLPYQPDLDLPERWADVKAFRTQRAAIYSAETTDETADAALAYGHLLHGWLPAAIRHAAPRP